MVSLRQPVTSSSPDWQVDWKWNETRGGYSSSSCRLWRHVPVGCFSHVKSWLMAKRASARRVRLTPLLSGRSRPGRATSAWWWSRAWGTERSPPPSSSPSRPVCWPKSEWPRSAGPTSKQEMTGYLKSWKVSTGNPTDVPTSLLRTENSKLSGILRHMSTCWLTRSKLKLPHHVVSCF